VYCTNIEMFAYLLAQLVVGLVRLITLNLIVVNYVVLRALWKIDVHLISTLVNKSLSIII